MTEEEIRDEIAKMNTLMKMFDIEATVGYYPERSLPFYLHGKLGDVIFQGISRSTLEGIQEVVHAYFGGRRSSDLLSRWC